MELLTKLIDIVGIFQEFDNEMPLLTLKAFLFVCLYQNKENGLSVKDVSELLEVSGAAGSRNVSKLYKYGGAKGNMNLVEVLEDPNYRVRKLIRLTKRGEKLKKQLMDIIAQG